MRVLEPTMERLLPRVLLLLFLLGCTAGEGRRDTTRLNPYGAPLLDDPTQCSAHLKASEGSSLDRDPSSPTSSPTSSGKAGAGDPPAEKTSRSWDLLSSVTAEEISRFSAKESTDAAVLTEGEKCSIWAPEKASPIETFPCPIHINQQKMFCCGTCTASYCCSSPDERLNQERCFEIMKMAEDRRASLPELTPPDKSIYNSQILLAVIGICCVCVGAVMAISYCQDQKLILAQEAAACEPLNVKGEPPASRRAASGDAGPSSLVVEESQRSSEPPTAVATSSGCSGSPMEQDTAV